LIPAIWTGPSMTVTAATQLTDAGVAWRYGRLCSVARVLVKT